MTTTAGEELLSIFQSTQWPATWSQPSAIDCRYKQLWDPQEVVLASGPDDPGGQSLCYPPATIIASDYGPYKMILSHNYIATETCPDGWKSAKASGSSTVVIISGDEGTLVTCCPSGWTFTELDTSTVVTYSFGGAEELFYSFCSTAFPGTATIRVPSTSANLTVNIPTLLTTATALANPITVAYFGTSVAVSAAANAGLSTGAKTGIRIGAAALAFVIIGVIVFLLRRRMRRRRRVTPDIPELDAHSDKKKRADLEGSKEVGGRLYKLPADAGAGNRTAGSKLPAAPVLLPAPVEHAEKRRYETEERKADPSYHETAEAAKKRIEVVPGAGADGTSVVNQFTTPPAVNETTVPSSPSNNIERSETQEAISPVSPGGATDNIADGKMDLELQWLEEEEARLRERRDKILALKRGGGS